MYVIWHCTPDATVFVEVAVTKEAAIRRANELAEPDTKPRPDEWYIVTPCAVAVAARKARANPRAFLRRSMLQM